MQRNSESNESPRSRTVGLISDWMSSSSGFHIVRQQVHFWHWNSHGTFLRVSDSHCTIRIAQSSAMIEVFASVCRQQEMPRYISVVRIPTEKLPFSKVSCYVSQWRQHLHYVMYLHVVMYGNIADRMTITVGSHGILIKKVACSQMYFCFNFHSRENWSYNWNYVYTIR